MTDPREQILDAFLDEMLNDSRPGRSAEDIVRQLQSGSRTLSTNDHPSRPVAPVIPEPIIPFPPSTIPQSPVPPVGVSWVRLAIFGAAATVTLVAALVFLMVFDDDAPVRLARPAEKSGGSPIATGPEIPEEDPSQPENETGIAPPAIAENRNDDKGLFSSDILNEPDNAVAMNEGQHIPRDDIPSDQTALIKPAKFERVNVPSAKPVSSAEYAGVVDQLLGECWKASGLEPVSPLEPIAWASRLTSRLLGRVPTADEMSELQSIVISGGDAKLQRQSIANWLLSDSGRKDEFSRHWGQVLAWDLLGIGRIMQASDPDIVRVREILASEIARNASMDEVAYRLFSATGSTDPSSDEHSPEASFLFAAAKRFGNMEMAAAHLGTTLGGRSMQCATCHDSGLGTSQVAGMKQKEFYEFLSFFAQTRIEGQGNGHALVVNRNYLPLAGEQKTEAPLRFRSFDGTESEAFPRFAGAEPAPNGFVAKVDRRTILASTIVASEAFRNAMTDLVWTALLNVPLGGIDNTILSPDDPVCRIRQGLGEQFAANGYDLGWLVTTIALSDAFAVGVGNAEQLAENNPFLGAAPRFNQFYQRIENLRMPVDSLKILAGAYQNRDSEAALSAGLLARISGNEQRTPDRVIQAYLPTNDNEWATSPRVSALLEAIAASEMMPEAKIEHLVHAALGRKALPEEVSFGVQVLNASSNPRLGLQDIWWGLLNSVEYDLPLKAR
jgi:Protein of unknown function (DUF1549)